MTTKYVVYAKNKNSMDKWKVSGLHDEHPNPPYFIDLNLAYKAKENRETTFSDCDFEVREQ